MDAQALEQDHSLNVHWVFTEDFVTNWITYKIDKEINPMRMHHPYEFAPYYDA